jgi:ribosomal protein S18 acetylase RimI-like enzyme
MDQGFTIEPARQEELPLVFRMAFRHLPQEEREARVANALHLLRQGELDPQGVLVARSGRTILGALVCLQVAGASALFWPPQALAGEQKALIENALLLAGQNSVRAHGAKLAQTLLAPHECDLADSLERNGFVHITSLRYMRCPLNHRVNRVDVESRLNYQPYSVCSEQLFQDTLLRTYEQSLDCPELTGLRTPQEILEGHKAQGEHDPERWWLAWEGPSSVGILMTTIVPEWQALDISYVGVVPRARGRGLGRQLVAKALEEARTADMSQVTLAVDSRNQPALDLYRRMEFEAFDEREVYLAVWQNPAASSRRIRS